MYFEFRLDTIRRIILFLLYFSGINRAFIRLSSLFYPFKKLHVSHFELKRGKMTFLFKNIILSHGKIGFYYLRNI